MARTLFIGDIHGCYDELIELIEKMKITADDTLYVAGDMINGGPKSFEVIEYISQHGKPVFGNHEINFFNYVADTNPDKKIKPFFQELQEKLKQKPELLDWLRSLPKYIETERFLLVHAGLKPGVSLENQDLNDLTRIREYEGKPWHDFYTADKMIIYGHWAQQGLRFTRNTRGLDSGCMWGGHLTGYCLETGEIWQTRAQLNYQDWRNDDK